jgi:acetoin utilization deacetylase AcuC-like enzyme
VAQAFKPDLIIVSAGQDAHASEFVAQMRLTDEGYAHMTRMVKELARELCDSKLAFVLEGGYNPKVTARAVETIVRTLQSPQRSVAELTALKPARPLPASQLERIRRVKQAHLAYWPTLG